MLSAEFKLTPIPDEAIFGLGIQIGFLKGAATYSDCLRLVFGEKRKRWIDTLDTDRERLELLLKYVAVDSVEELLTNHTAWPYLISFQNTSVTAVLGLGQEKLSPTVPLGLNGPPPIKDRKVAKYCCYCAAEQLEKYHRTTWLRSHQLPGVTVCHRHGAALSESLFDLELNSLLNQEVVFPLVAHQHRINTCAEECHQENWHITQPYRMWSQISRDFLASSELFSDKCTVLALYRNALADRGLLIKDKYDWRGIEDLFRQRYGDLFAKEMQINFSCKQLWSWLRSLFVGAEYYRQPVRHLLVIGALFDSFYHVETAMAHELCGSRDDLSIKNSGKLKEERKFWPNQVLSREQLLQILKDTPKVTRSSLRQIIGNRKYDWLNENDGEWLEQEVIIKSNYTRAKSADWHARKSKIVSIIEKLSNEQRCRVFTKEGINVSELSRIAKISYHVVRKIIKDGNLHIAETIMGKRVYSNA